MDLAETTPLSTVEGWKRKACEVSIQSDDSFVSVISKGFDVATLMIKDSELGQIQRALGSLDMERSYCWGFENNEELSIRPLMYGLIQSFHLAFLHLLNEKVHSNEKMLKLENNFQKACRAAREAELRAERAENLLDNKPGLIDSEGKVKEELEETKKKLAEVSIQLEEVKERAETSLIENTELKRENGALNAKLAEMGDSMDNQSTVPNFTRTIKQKEGKVEPKKETIDEIQPIIGDNQISALEDYMGDETDLHGGEITNDNMIVGNERPFSHNDEPIDTEGEMEDTADHTAAIPKETAEVERRKRPARNAPKHQKNNENMDDSGEETEPSVKKPKSDFAKTPKCILCEKFPKTALQYALHLKNQHKSALTFNGISLICSCGDEVRSPKSSHNKECSGLKFILHKLSEKNPTTPRCILCETYPTTPFGYTNHLHRHHKTSLKSSGIFLICSCGLEFRNNTGNPDHSKKCNGKQFALHKLDEK